jgi:hypothetical protein
MNRQSPTPSPSSLPATTSSFPLIVALTVGLLLVYLAGQLLTIFLQNRPLLEWWGHAHGQYARYLNFWHLLTRRQGSSLLYAIQGMFLSPDQSQITLAQERFILGSLLRYQLYTDERGKQHGILTPRHLCESILPQQGDGDEGFDTWIKGQRLDDTCQLRYVAKEGTTGQSQAPFTYYVTGTPNGNSCRGVYPAQGDRESWKGLVQMWLNGGRRGAAMSLDQMTWAWHMEGDIWKPFLLRNTDGTKALSNWWDVAR